MEGAVGSFTVRLTATAAYDLQDVLQYLADSGGESLALRYFAHLSRKIASLADLPGRGVPRTRLSRGVRMLVHEPHTIWYRIEGREVTVLRVLHIARDVSAIARRGGLNED